MGKTHRVFLDIDGLIFSLYAVHACPLAQRAKYKSADEGGSMQFAVYSLIIIITGYGRYRLKLFDVPQYPLELIQAVEGNLQLALTRAAILNNHSGSKFF